MTRRELIKRLESAAAGLYPAREASSVAYLVAEALCGITRMDVAAEPGASVEWGPELARAEEEIARGRPVQYVLGRAWFCSREFRVGEGVLIPRPETEELVRWIAGDIRDCEGGSGIGSKDSGPCSGPGSGSKDAGSKGARILDVGTGSGAIAVSLALECPGSEVAAVDISPEALAYAHGNASALGAQVSFAQADILAEDLPFPAGAFDVIVSNPPYIPQTDRPSMHRNVTGYEPAQALFVPDGDPLLFYRAIARHGRKLLAPGGRLYFEIYEKLAAEMVKLLDKEGYSDVYIKEDIHGKQRMVRCVKR